MPQKTLPDGTKMVELWDLDGKIYDSEEKFEAALDAWKIAHPEAAAQYTERLRNLITTMTSIGQSNGTLGNSATSNTIFIEHGFGKVGPAA